ncbi:MAG: ATP-binding protein [Actinobacteria bacterium]|nr:ATP-binding protein [Actinomycetota bacterium]
MVQTTDSQPVLSWSDGRDGGAEARRPLTAPQDSSRVDVALVLPAAISSVRGARNALRWALCHVGWPGPDRLRVIIAANEAIVNAIEHGSGTGGKVTVTFGVEEHLSTVTVCDEGASVVRRRVGGRGPHAGRLPHRGHGRALIVGLADHARTHRTGRGTEVTMWFRPPRDTCRLGPG